MMMFDEMGFCGDLDFFPSLPIKGGDMCAQQPAEAEAEAEPEPVPVVEDDYTDEEIDVDELERRMWRDKMRLKRLKETNKGKEGVDYLKQLQQSQEQAGRKMMSRSPASLSPLNGSNHQSRRGGRRCRRLKIGILK